MVDKKIRFIKEGNQWFVDLPDYIEKFGIESKGNLLMVAGADTFLELHSDGNPFVDVFISEKPFDDCLILKLDNISVDKEMLEQYDHPNVEFGGNYTVVGLDWKMWLCPTLLYVFESETYPEIIYFKIIELLEPLYIPDFTTKNLINQLITEINWIDQVKARKECFMSDIEREYQYITDGPLYKSETFHPLVLEIMNEVNKVLNSQLNVCFLNYYENQTKALGWHSDDSHPIDQTQPIAVVSIGQEREIWCKPIGFQGNIPDEWKQKLGDGSLFVMPAGMQDTHRHKIPKGDRQMGPRISLTFRAWKKN